MGNKKIISVILTPDVKTGDWVLIHAGEAISLISDEDAEASLEVWEQLLNE
jgi:hydrogenase expression/formation protein HypC